MNRRSAIGAFVGALSAALIGCRAANARMPSTLLERVWSGRPYPYLVDHVALLAPSGTVLVVTEHAMDLHDDYPAEYRRPRIEGAMICRVLEGGRLLLLAGSPYDVLPMAPDCLVPVA
jgi:hypothetical protein